MTGGVRVALADDHPVVRAGLKTLLDGEPDIMVVADVADGASALRAAIDLRPDVFVMDISLPGVSGAEATEQIRRECPDIRVVALTAHEEVAYARVMLQARVRGYVLKRAAAEDLVTAIRVVAAGGTYLDPTIACQLIAPGKRLARRLGVEAALSEREGEALKLIAQGHTIKEIAGRLELSPRTLETYKARAMEKLGIKNRADIVRYALQRGWLKDL